MILENKLAKGLSDPVINIVRASYHKLMREVDEPNKVAWFETCVVSLLVFALSWFINPDDVLLLEQDFLWLLIAPLFLALRHGFMFGFVSALFFIGLTVVMWRMGGAQDFSATALLGLLIVTSLAGEFSDFWQRRLGRLEIESKQRHRRMEEFTRSYHLLRLSHDQLVEQLAGSSVSLRQAVTAMRQEMLDSKSNPLESEAERILALFRRYGAVQSASLHRVEHGKLDVNSLGRLGAVPEDMHVLNQSSIIREALATAEMITALASENGTPRYVDGNILAVVPVGDLSGKIWALLVIYRMPFLKFTEDNLSLIAVMGSCLGDLLCELDKKMQGKQVVRADFHAELKRSIRYAGLYGMHAKLVSIELTDHNADAFEGLLSSRRSLDATLCRTSQEGCQIALWLMPFCNDIAVAGFQTRINMLVRQILPDENEEELVKFHTFNLNGKHSADVVMEEVSYACNLADC